MILSEAKTWTKNCTVGSPPTMLFFGKKSSIASEPPPVASDPAPDMVQPAPVILGFGPPPGRQLKQKARRLKHQLRALERTLGRHRAPPPVPAKAEPAPPVKKELPPPVPAAALDEAAVGGLVGKAPALVELQYEVLDLRLEVEILKRQVTALLAKMDQQAAEVKTSQLTIADDSGRVVAAFSKDGSVTCRRIDLHPGPA